MYIIEKSARMIRNLPVLRKLNFFWRLITPAYEYSLKLIYGDLLQRKISKTDIIYIPHYLRHFTEKYETEFWNGMMRQVRPGDTIADVGAFFGFYTFALAKRAGANGKVVAFEPDPANLKFLKKIVKRYKFSSTLEIAGLAVGDRPGRIKFNNLSASTSAVIANEKLKTKKATEVACTTLDDFFSGEKLDIIKIDVEGYEEKVLMGAQNILRRGQGFPRAIFIEMHPYAWKDYGTTDLAIISILKSSGYRIDNLKGEPINSIKEYGGIIARRD
ncbi:MAG: FkbM family methyltransferase [Candidatus Omnitrophota bacterium]|nr:FkbM family methyltransferase [Candidatus Omnitrophota bacterium]MBU1928480.1 FkbM family methyltransferase [Candidatus Omnitrophota bacterium]MBU2035447.1 FkbM family methyltransferase [Candidatus Omnitrophota bacterium]MBU2257870.1 FkbM family methyltransferase [Candidatus Omnitrophota bacterium]